VDKVNKYLQDNKLQYIIEISSFDDFKGSLYMFLTNSISSINRSKTDKEMIKTLESLKGDIGTLIKSYKNRI
jgi:hypothetical protein